MSSRTERYVGKDGELICIYYESPCRMGDMRQRIDRVIYKGDKLHCVYAPALDYGDEKNSKHWFLNGQKIECKSQEEFELLLKFIPFW